MKTIYTNLPIKYAKIVASEMRKDIVKALDKNEFDELDDMIFDLKVLVRNIENEEKEDEE